jgi:signal transduction histidine kinase/CheY-like chemotaxis protein/HPt (histidine-containing phosphotransfer) domain-containing protein
LSDTQKPIVNSSAPLAATRDKLRLRRLLTLPFVALVLIPAMIIAASSLYSGLKAVDLLSRQLIDNISSRVEQAAVHQLDEASITLRAAHPDPANSADGAMSAFTNFESIERRLFELTAQARTTSYLYFGAADGSFVGVDRTRPGAQAAATVRLQLEPNRPRKIYSARGPLDRSRLIETESRVYDARDRVWFYTAKDAQKVSWTPIYVSFASGELVTTASQSVTTQGGRFLGVLAADVVLSELSAFMKTIAVSDNGVAFIVDGQGYLVATSSLDAPFTSVNGEQKRVSAAEAKNELLQVSAKWINERDAVIPATGAPLKKNIALNSVRSAVLSSSFGKVDVSSRPVSRIEGTDWQVVVAVPRSDFTSTIVSSAILTFLVTLAALIASLLLGLWVLRRVTDDVEALVHSTNQISGDQLPDDLPIPKLHETTQLADAFRAMIGRVRDSLTTIRAQNVELADLNAGLETRVAERTDELRKRNERLSDEIALRTRYERELSDASKNAMAMADNKAKFLAMLSHELRTPLQAVIGSGQMLSSRLSDQPKELATLDAGAKSLLALVDGVLAFSRLEAGRVNPLPSRFELTKCIEEARLVVAGSRPTELTDISTEIAAGVPRYVHADMGMMRQVITNLLHNAIKHAPDKPIIIRMAPDTVHRNSPSAQHAHAVWLRITVIDRGPGISAADQQRLFRPFEQLNNVSGTDPNRGSGLGLAICALLVKEMHGEISVQSELGHGTAFSFSVPIEVIGAASQSAEPHRSAELVGTGAHEANPMPQLRVLLVEDHQINRALVAQLLERLNQSVVAVGSGEEALEQLKHAAFDLVVLDLNLPGISGIETAKRYLTMDFARAADYEFSAPMLVALTASDDAADRANALAAGFDLFLTKPTTLGKLEAMLLRVSAGRTPVKPRAQSGASSLLDAEHLNQLLMADRGSKTLFLAALLKQFSESISSELGAIEAACRKNDTTTLRALCHASRGAALSIGATRLAGQLATVAELGQQADLPALKQVVSETQAALTQWSQNHFS